MLYRLFVPSQAFGTSVVFFDLFNPSGSTVDLELKSCIPIVSGATAVTGVIGVDIFLTRTSAVGTGGTAATSEGTSLTACTITGIDTTQGVGYGVTARLTPTGGATAGGVICWRSVFTEETNAGTYSQELDMARNGSDIIPGQLIKPATGIRVVQNAVASVGNIGFDVIFEVKPTR